MAFSCQILFLIGVALVSLASGRALNTDEDSPPRIGIIGGGLGGTSTAFFLRQLYGPKLTIDVFEADKVGGRVTTININGQDYEAGGTIIHRKNKYMVEFAKKFNLTQFDNSDGVLGLWAEDGMRLQTSEWSAVTLAKLVWRYGMDLYTARHWVSNVGFKQFARIYQFQDRGMAFTTLEDMLRAMGDDLLNMTRHTMREVLQDIGLSQTFIDEFAAAAVKDNYGQTVEANGFLGVVSLMAVEPELWSIQDGNQQMAEILLRESKANLVKGTVKTVALIKDDMGTGGVSYELDYTKGTDSTKTESREYDIVIVAAPLNEETKNKISFADFPVEVLSFKQDYLKLVCAFVQGKINASAFNVDSPKECPDAIISISPNYYFNSVVMRSPVSPNTKPETSLGADEAVWRVFFSHNPTEEDISRLFVSHSDLRLVDWWAYPEYRAGMELPPFMLYDRLYYVNAIESAASAMEMALIGGRNVALLAHNQWHSNFDKIDEVQLPQPTGSSGDAQKSEL
ncbi:hypothetical protein EGW08_008117 [Elysia chlorotica]|uniref:Prenylcysteine lyase domain-containing protein n=1 Tax=Elysia chlorotica TaxID=188477 RepID=A0A433TR97_ELYCH|nr:hypothetical protein EGW08_008117 [Elysia chlorotica]